jgi:hypothetical protein
VNLSAVKGVFVHDLIGEHREVIAPSGSSPPVNIIKNHL